MRISLLFFSCLCAGTGVGFGAVTYGTYPGGVGRISSVAIGAASSALLTVDASGAGQCAAINADGTRNSGSRPVAEGSYVSLYLIGAGKTGQVDGALAVEASALSPAPVGVTLSVR